MRGDAGLAAAAGLIRGSYAFRGVTLQSLAAAVSWHSDRRHEPYERSRMIRRDGCRRGGLRGRHSPGRARLGDRGCAFGAVVGRRSVRASARGYAAALQFAGEVANGAGVWVIEGAGHYGAGLARFLVGHGEAVLEVSRAASDKPPRRRRVVRTHLTESRLLVRRRALAPRKDRWASRGSFGRGPGSVVVSSCCLSRVRQCSGRS